MINKTARQAIEIVKNTFFSNFTDTELSILEKALVIEDHNAGYCLFHEGDNATSIYIILSGSVLVEKKHSKNKKNFELAKLNPGDTIGELAFLDHSPRTATVTTITKTSLAKLSNENLEKLGQVGLNIIQKIRSNISVQIVNNFRKLNSSYVNSIQENVKNVGLSRKDSLTGVFNRRYFDTYIKQAVEKSDEIKKPICMIILDIDNFKQVNDTYGHQAGDSVLKSFATLLKSAFRKTDLIARYGGEEFVILLNLDLEKCILIAKRILIKIAKTKFIIPEQQKILHKTSSIGIAQYTPGNTVEEFINKADKALYEAKKTGKNKLVIANP